MEGRGVSEAASAGTGDSIGSMFSLLLAVRLPGVSLRSDAMTVGRAVGSGEAGASRAVGGAVSVAADAVSICRDRGFSLETTTSSGTRLKSVGGSSSRLAVRLLVEREKEDLASSPVSVEPPALASAGHTFYRIRISSNLDINRAFLFSFLIALLRHVLFALPTFLAGLSASR